MNSKGYRSGLIAQCRRVPPTNKVTLQMTESYSFGCVWMSGGATWLSLFIVEGGSKCSALQNTSLLYFHMRVVLQRQVEYRLASNGVPFSFIASSLTDRPRWMMQASAM